MELDESVSQIECSYKVSVDPDTMNSIVSHWDEYNAILSAWVSKQINRIKQMSFEIEGKPQNLLAQQLRQTQAFRATLRINSDTGTVLTDPKEINTHFVEFYTELYKSNDTTTLIQLSHFFLN